MEDITKDERFSHVLKDPRFKRIPVKDKKTKIDKRFQAMFEKRDFNLKCTMDKRGRPINHTSSEDLKKFYELSSENESDLDENKESNESKLSKNKTKHSLMKKNKSNSKSFSEESDEDLDFTDSNDLVSCHVKTKGKNLKTSRAQFSEVDAESENSSDDDSDDDEEESEEESDTGLGAKFDHRWGELDADAPNADEVTRRLALCNMDWDNIEIKTIMALCNSFKPDDGVINSVKIFPSAYGLQCMEEEKIKGPVDLIEKTIDSVQEDEEQDNLYQREKLRQYQLKRLKYFYAVIDCNSIETASRIYDNLDGKELGNSSVVIDLRYIPDDMEFNEEPSSVLTEINMADYEARSFVNKALQESKPDCTWDRTDPKRLEIMQKAFKDPESISVDDLNNVFAPYSSEEESDDGTELIEESKNQKMSETISKYRSLLQLAEEKDKKDEEEYHIEFSWDPGLKENTEKVVQEKLKKQNLTPFQEKLLKMKEDKKNKKRARKERLMEEDNSDEASANDDSFSNTKMTESERNAAELALLVAEPGKESTLAFDTTKSKKKNRKIKKMEKKSDSFTVDTQDERFSAMYTSHHFHIDQTDPHFKNTKGVQAIIEEKQRKRKNEFGFGSANTGENQPKHMKLSSDNMNLVNSVKQKARYFQKRK